MANFNTDVVFKYGETSENLPDSQTAGTFYIKQKDSSKAELYLDPPTGGDRLMISGGSGDIFVGDPDAEGSDADDYDVIINPNGEVIENWVTTETTGGFVIRIESREDVDNWTPTDTPSKNTIIFVVES